MANNRDIFTETQNTIAQKMASDVTSFSEASPLPKPFPRTGTTEQIETLLDSFCALESAVYEHELRISFFTVPQAMPSHDPAVATDDTQDSTLVVKLRALEEKMNNLREYVQYMTRKVQ